MEIASLVLLGTCVGTFGTMIGLGGGLILVPLFMFTMLAPHGTTFEVVQQVIGTSLFAVACNSVSGAYALPSSKAHHVPCCHSVCLGYDPGCFCR